MSTLQDLVVKVGVDDDGVTKGGKKLEGKFDKVWSNVQKGAAIAGAAIGVAVMAGMSKMLDSEAATDKLAARLGATAQEADRWGQVAGDLYADAWGASMEEVTAAVDAVVGSIDGMRSAGSADLEAMTAKALTLATTFELDVARAAQVAGQAVTSGLAKDATQAMDLLAASLAKVPAHVREDLLDALDEYGPFLASIGLQGERAFGLLVKGAEKGMYGIDKTGDALKEFTIRATDMSTASKVGFDLLGLSQKEMAGRLLAGGDTAAKAFEQIVTGLRKIKDPVAQSQAALALFGTPLEDLSVSEIPKFLAGLDKAAGGLGDVTGAADKMSATLNDNAKTTLETFKRKVEQAFIEKLSAAVPYLEATFGWLSRNSGWVVPLVGGLTGLVAVIYAISLAMKAWAVIQVILNLALWTSPITWIVAAIIVLVAIIVLIATKTDWFQRAWNTVWGGVKAVAKAIGSWFAGPFAGFFVALWDGIVSGVRGVHNWILNIFTKIVKFVVGIPGTIKSGLSVLAGILTAPFRAAFNAISRLWNGTVGKLSFSLPGWVPGLGGKGFSMPKLPQLAKGGIVKHRPGGTLALLGEGGQDERVTPLPRGVPGAGHGEPVPVVLSLAPGSSDRQLLTALLGALRANGLKIERK